MKVLQSFLLHILLGTLVLAPLETKTFDTSKFVNDNATTLLIAVTSLLGIGLWGYTKGKGIIHGQEEVRINSEQWLSTNKLYIENIEQLNYGALQEFGYITQRPNNPALLTHRIITYLQRNGFTIAAFHTQLQEHISKLGMLCSELDMRMTSWQRSTNAFLLEIATELKKRAGILHEHLSSMYTIINARIPFIHLYEIVTLLNMYAYDTAIKALDATDPVEELRKVALIKMSGSKYPFADCDKQVRTHGHALAVALQKAQPTVAEVIGSESAGPATKLAHITPQAQALLTSLEKIHTILSTATYFQQENARRGHEAQLDRIATAKERKAAAKEREAAAAEQNVREIKRQNDLKQHENELLMQKIREMQHVELFTEPLKRTIAQLKQTIQEQEDEKKGLKKQYHQLQQAYQKLIAQHTYSQNANVTQQIKNLEQEIAAKEQEIKTCKNSLRQLNDQKNSMLAKLKRIETKITELYVTSSNPPGNPQALDDMWQQFIASVRAKTQAISQEFVKSD